MTSGHPMGQARDELIDRLADQLPDDAIAALREAVQAIGRDDTAIRSRFPSATRIVGRGPLLADDDPQDPFTVMADDTARAAMILSLDPAAMATELGELYRHGDARERRGVLRALDTIPDLDQSDPVLKQAALSLVDDALRTNDIRLVAAALGSAGVTLLDDEMFAQAMLKCVFVGVDIRRVPGLMDRTTPELSRMMADFVHERIAAGRDITPAVWPVIDAHPPQPQLEAIRAELDSPVERRADAARAALSHRN